MGHGTLLAEKPVGAHGSLTVSSTIAATRAGPVDNAARIRHAEQPPGTRSGQPQPDQAAVIDDTPFACKVLLNARESRFSSATSRKNPR